MTHSQIKPIQGFLFSLLTTVLWGALPIFLTLVLTVMDGPTITFYRFAVAACCVFLLLMLRGDLPSFRLGVNKSSGLVLIAVMGLTFNYVFNLYGLALVNPETVQVVTQLAPFMLMLGSIVLYRERFNRQESLGAVVLMMGLLVFFNDNLGRLLAFDSDYGLGVLYIVLGCVAWATYGLLQKQLLRQHSAKQLTLFIYTGGALILIPAANMEQLFSLNTLQLWALVFCCLNTVFAYGAFTEAMNVWQGSKVSAVIAATPVFTFLFMELSVSYWPAIFTRSELNSWAYVGAGLVVVGSILTALRKQDS